MRTEFLPNFIFGLVFFILLSGCESKPDFIGSDLLPSGEYEIQVTLDNSQNETHQCRISSASDHTAVG